MSKRAGRSVRWRLRELEKSAAAERQTHVGYTLYAQERIHQLEAQLRGLDPTVNVEGLDQEIRTTVVIPMGALRSARHPHQLAVDTGYRVENQLRVWLVERGYQDPRVARPRREPPSVGRPCSQRNPCGDERCSFCRPVYRSFDARRGVYKGEPDGG